MEKKYHKSTKKKKKESEITLQIQEFVKGRGREKSRMKGWPRWSPG
jgi:hypothetical protein